MSLREALDGAMTERQFQDAVIELARLHGWMIHHARPARTDKGWSTPIQGDVGFPDLILVKPPRIVILELKAERGRIRDEQQRWLEAFDSCPDVACYVARPSHWPTLVALLTRGGEVA